jgi:hypothetical protein
MCILQRALRCVIPSLHQLTACVGSLRAKRKKPLAKNAGDFKRILNWYQDTIQNIQLLIVDYCFSSLAPTLVTLLASRTDMLNLSMTCSGLLLSRSTGSQSVLTGPTSTCLAQETSGENSTRLMAACGQNDNSQLPSTGGQGGGISGQQEMLQMKTALHKNKEKANT